VISTARLSLKAQPEPIELDPKASAVCVIDMQNWDVAPGGFFDLTQQDTTHGRKVLEPIKAVLKHARAAGMPVVYTKNVLPRDPRLWPDERSPWYWKTNARQYPTDPALARGMCIEGSWGAEIVEELAPQEGDLVITKTLYSGFVRTQLDVLLRRHGIRYLFLTGIGTPTCVEATARDAYYYEYWPVLIADCCAAKVEETHHQALEAIKRRYGWVTTSADVASALAESAP